MTQEDFDDFVAWVEEKFDEYADKIVFLENRVGELEITCLDLEGRDNG